MRFPSRAGGVATGPSIRMRSRNHRRGSTGCLLIIGSTNDLDNEVEPVGLVYEFELVLGGIGE